MPATTQKTVDLDELRESPFNPRRIYGNLSELATSIKAKGILQPPLARPTKDGLELVFGHRRVRAAKLAGLKKILVNVREMDDAEALEEQLIENSQREDIHPMDEAEAYGRLRDEYGKRKKGARFVETLAERTGKSRAHVFGRLKLLDLTLPAREAFVKNPKLSGDGMLEISRLENERLQLRALERYESGGPGGDPLSVRALRLWIRDTFKDEKRGRGGKAPTPKEEREHLERTAAATVTKMVTMLERERGFEHYQVKTMALALLDRGASSRLLARRQFGSEEQLRRAAENKLSPAELRALAFELAIDPWVRVDGDDYSAELKALAKAFGIDMRALEEAESLFDKKA